MSHEPLEDSTPDLLYGGPEDRARRLAHYREIAEATAEEQHRLKSIPTDDPMFHPPYTEARCWVLILEGKDGVPMTCPNVVGYRCNCGQVLEIQEGIYGPFVRCVPCKTGFLTIGSKKWHTWGGLERAVICGAELEPAGDRYGHEPRCTRCDWTAQHRAW